MSTSFHQIDDEFEAVVDHPVVLLKRQGRYVIDHRGQPINFWLLDAAIKAIPILRRQHLG